MFDKIRPLYDRVLVQRLDAEERTSGGIYIPDTAKEKGQKGKVVAVGAGRLDPKDGKLTPLLVKVDDIVIFGKYAGTDTGGNCLIVKEDDILGVVEK